MFKFSDVERSLAFFEKYPILALPPLTSTSRLKEWRGVKSEKAKDYSDFSIVANLMKNKVHLTKSGVAEIRKIKMGMNRGR